MALGNLGKGLADKARSVKQSADSAVDRLRDRAEEPASRELEVQGVQEVPETAESEEERADAAEVAQEASRLRELLARARPVPEAVTEPWSFGLGVALKEHPKVPGRVGKLLGKLDNFVGLSITPDAVVVDGEEVQWSQVTEIRTRNLLEYLLADSVSQQIEQLPIPPFPGRARVIDSLSRAVLTLLIAYAKDTLNDHGAALRIPAEIDYRGTGVFKKSKQLNPGTFSTIILADPAVTACLVATAQRAGVPVTAAADEIAEAAEERAAVLKARIAGLEARLARLRR
ncbi:hypothetical protein [Actinokineospora sp. NBRC 105648]|uniref:hypothetical protein n=1 Tax=Actinokineospora sp. NBRC 105648 TaxID=3032206 RepID=UPI0024A3CC74|nr:hypothetical protein [Actinokineospora sp. NBRC 105648]GLZ39677.1 hypothetical protein Acsp05_33010 [Actinokineospora sp. NBRC 105648]